MNVKEWIIDDSRSIYPQLKEIIKKRIIVGMYGKGESFPTVRELAQEACVNRNTMQRALSELEEEGLLITNRTVGRTVTTDENLIMQIRTQLAKEQVDMFIKEMASLGYCIEETLSLVEEMHFSRINI